MNSARLPVVLSLMAVATIAPVAAAQPGIGHAEISEWIASHHPNVIAGDRSVNAVLLVVDSLGHYAASVADSLPVAVTAAIDSMFASVGARNEIEGMARELVAGRLRVPGTGGNEPIYLVDGLRVRRVDSLPLNSIGNIRFMNVAEAVSAYGPDVAKGGAILVTMIHDEGWSRIIEASHRQRLSKLGIQPEQIAFGNTEMMDVRPGVYGPNRMYITVLRLKKH